MKLASAGSPTATTENMTMTSIIAAGRCTQGSSALNHLGLSYRSNTEHLSRGGLNNKNILSVSGLPNTTRSGAQSSPNQQGASVESTHVAVIDTGPFCEGEKNSQ